MTVNKTMVSAGVVTAVQAAGQMIFTSLALAQYFCVIDFLQELPLLLFIKILYFHNPGPCGSRVNIGHAIENIPNQAFVLIREEPLTVMRTFIINCISLGLSFFWIITSALLMRSGARSDKTRQVRWPWIIVTVLVSALDVVATVTYTNDSFHTRTLSDIMDYVNGVASGVSNVEFSTSWASWVMVLIYSRFTVFFFLNLLLLILVIIEGNLKQQTTKDADMQVEAPTPTPPLLIPGSVSSMRDEEASLPSEEPSRIPRPGLSQSFRRMKMLLFNRQASPAPRRLSGPDSLDPSPDRIKNSRKRKLLSNNLRSPRVHHKDVGKKRTVNFPKNLLSLPQRLENMIAEQQRRLDSAVIDTAGRRSPPRVSQSLPQLATEQDTGQVAQAQQLDTKQHEPRRERRGTAAELQGQLPWAYIPASAHRMRDQLPPDEDLPPVPLPDYTAIPSFRKASVHRAASSLSSLTQKREYLAAQAARPPLTQSDVLY